MVVRVGGRWRLGRAWLGLGRVRTHDVRVSDAALLFAAVCVTTPGPVSDWKLDADGSPEARRRLCRRGAMVVNQSLVGSVGPLSVERWTK